MANKDDDFDPSKYATLKLWTHILEKGLQVGGFLGLVVIPAVWYKRKTFNASVVFDAAGCGGFTGLTIATAMGVYKLKDADQASIEDRVYRLHYNAGQVRTDGYARAGAILGASAASYAVWPPTPLGLFGGVALGSSLGVLYHVATMPKTTKPTHNQMLEEMKR